MAFPILADTSKYTDEELGMVLYNSMCITMESPEPYMFLSEEDKEYYQLAAREFIRYLYDNQTKQKNTVVRRLYYFDFTENQAKLVWFTADTREPHKWRRHKQRSKSVYFLGESVFQTRREAVEFGRNTIAEYVDSTAKTLDRLDAWLDEHNGTEAEEEENGEK